MAQVRLLFWRIEFYVLIVSIEFIPLQHVHRMRDWFSTDFEWGRKKIKIEINRLGQHLSIFHLVLMCYSYGYLILIVKINADAPIKMEIVFVEKTKKINQRKIKFWRELKYIAHKSVINWELSHSVYVCLVDVRTFECYMIFFIEIRWMVWFSFHLAMVLLLFQKAYRDLISPVNPLYVKMCVFFFSCVN